MAAAEQLFPTFPQPADEQARLAALHRSGAVDNASGPDFSFLTALAARLCGVPYAHLTLVDGDRAWVRAGVGLELDSLPRSQAYCAWAVLGDALTEIPDTTLDARTAGLALTVGAPHVRRYAGAPLWTTDGHPIGTLCVMDSRSGMLTPEQRDTLAGLARQAMALIEARAAERALRQSEQRLEQLATTDELTGLHNRRSLLHRLKFEVARARRFRAPLAAVMIDLDHFRRINDEHGHATGDRVLAAVGKLVRENVRMIDVAGRYGGEELCLLLPNTPLDGARKMAEALRGRIQAQLHMDGARRVPVTASFGVGAFDHMAIDDADTLLRAAEAALYAAKANGRNRIN